jgi:hypothetical protein
MASPTADGEDGGNGNGAGEAGVVAAGPANDGDNGSSDSDLSVGHVDRDDAAKKAGKGNGHEDETTAEFGDFYGGGSFENNDAT